MTALLQLPVNFSAFEFNNSGDESRSKRNVSGIKLSQPSGCWSFSRVEIGSLQRSQLKLGVYGEGSSFLGISRGAHGMLVTEGWKRRKKRVVLVRFNQRFGFNGGGGGRDDNSTARLLGNLALAVGLTYLSMTGQLGWLLDAIVSVWLIVVLLPIVGLGAFIWWAGRDIVQDSCPNCGNNFQIFKSSLNDGIQQCPFCGEPFSVVGNEFIRNPEKFSEQSTTFGQAFNNFSFHSKKGKDSSGAVVDVEAEIKDAD